MYREDASIVPDKYYRSSVAGTRPGSRGPTFAPFGSGCGFSRSLLTHGTYYSVSRKPIPDGEQTSGAKPMATAVPGGPAQTLVPTFSIEIHPQFAPNLSRLERIGTRKSSGKGISGLCPRWFSFFRGNLPRIALFRDPFGEGLEGGLDVDARLRGRETEGTVVRAGRLDHLVLRDLRLVLQVDLVPQEFDWNLPGDAVDSFDPVVEIIERLPAGHVAHRQDPAGAVEVRLLEEFPEALLTHDVPNRHVDLQLARALGHRGRQFLLRDLRAERLDVLVVEVVQDEPTDERRLPDGRLADEAHLHFHPLDFHERPPRNVE